MSMAKILTDLPKMTASDRAQLFLLMAELHKNDPVEVRLPSTLETPERVEFEPYPSHREPWHKALREIRAARR